MKRIIFILLLLVLVSGCSKNIEKTAVVKNDSQMFVAKTDEDQHSFSNEYVYITKTGKMYHKENCRYVAESKIKIEINEAKSYDYIPCSVCMP